MAEPTVQVPVSLIERAAKAVLRGWDSVAVHAELTALIAQPNPTAETGIIVSTRPLGERDDDSGLPEFDAEPPRIEDMAPGTTFTARQVGGHWLRLVRVVGGVEDVENLFTLVVDIDPSTIRDVTPPKGA